MFPYNLEPMEISTWNSTYKSGQCSSKPTLILLHFSLYGLINIFSKALHSLKRLVVNSQQILHTISWLIFCKMSLN